jgi:hypothetical protein
MTPTRDESIDNIHNEKPTVMQTMDTLESLIVNHPFLSGLNPHFYHFFNDCAVLQRFATGQEIFHEHGKADHFYLILNGKVALETFVPGCGMVTIQTLGSGEALGWSCSFPHINSTRNSLTWRECWPNNRVRADRVWPSLPMPARRPARRAVQGHPRRSQRLVATAVEPRQSHRHPG